jgi:hypothetical protein
MLVIVKIVRPNISIIPARVKSRGSEGGAAASGVDGKRFGPPRGSASFPFMTSTGASALDTGDRRTAPEDTHCHIIRCYPGQYHCVPCKSSTILTQALQGIPSHAQELLAEYR